MRKTKIAVSALLVSMLCAFGASVAWGATSAFKIKVKLEGASSPVKTYPVSFSSTDSPGWQSSQIAFSCSAWHNIYSVQTQTVKGTPVTTQFTGMQNTTIHAGYYRCTFQTPTTIGSGTLAFDYQIYFPIKSQYGMTTKNLEVTGHKIGSGNAKVLMQQKTDSPYQSWQSASIALKPGWEYQISENLSTCLKDTQYGCGIHTSAKSNEGISVGNISISYHY